MATLGGWRAWHRRLRRGGGGPPPADGAPPGGPAAEQDPEGAGEAPPVDGAPQGGDGGGGGGGPPPGANAPPDGPAGEEDPQGGDEAPPVDGAPQDAPEHRGVTDAEDAAPWARHAAAGALRGLDDEEEGPGGHAPDDPFQVILALHHARSQLQPDDLDTQYSKMFKCQLDDKAFRDCGLNAMVEQVLKSWTTEDQEKLADSEHRSEEKRSSGSSSKRHRK